jgi:F-type H+-transporting ATPase subunit b
MRLRKGLLLSFISIALLFTGVGVFGYEAAAATPTQTTTTTEETAGTTLAEQTTPVEEEAGVVGLFGLNWKLFLAQLVNFGIILFVLWKWVWGPVTKGLSDRTEKIENSLQEAEKILKDRADFDSWKQGEIAKVRIEAAGIITEAKQSAMAFRQETLDQTKSDQAKIIEQTQHKLAQEKEKLISDARSEIAGLVIQSTEVILQEKLNAKKDSELIDKALRGLK